MIGRRTAGVVLFCLLGLLPTTPIVATAAPGPVTTPQLEFVSVDATGAPLPSAQLAGVSFDGQKIFAYRGDAEFLPANVSGWYPRDIGAATATNIPLVVPPNWQCWSRYGQFLSLDGRYAAINEQCVNSKVELAGIARIYDTVAGRYINPCGPTAQYCSIGAYSGSGQFAYVSEFSPGPCDGNFCYRFIRYDLFNGKTVDGSTVSGVQQSDDGNIIVVDPCGGQCTTINVTNLKSGKTLPVYVCRWVTYLLSGDGNTFVTNPNTGTFACGSTATIFNVRTGRAKSVDSTLVKGISDNGRFLLSQQSRSPNPVTFSRLDLETGSKISVPISFGSNDFFAGFSGDGQWLFVNRPAASPPGVYRYGPFDSGVGTLPPPVTSAPTARPNDELLTRRLPLTAPAGAIAVQYGWAQSPTATEPDFSLPLQGSAQLCWLRASCLLDFSPTTPSTQWYLLARSVDAAGLTGPWSAPQLIPTPPKPELIALGDSITSGHHKDSNFGTTVCDDPTYSYAQAYFTHMQAVLPPAWQSSTYLTYAHSGFGTADTVWGGTTSCGMGVSTAPLLEAEDALAPIQNSWNRVLISAGVNDTNWPGVLGTIVFHDRLPGRYKRTQCVSDVAGWNGYDVGITSTIGINIGLIVSGLRNADPSLTIDWLGYYQVAGTGTNKVSTRPAIPAVCTAPINTALDYLNKTLIQAALRKKQVQFIDTNVAIGANDSDLQGFYQTDYATCAVSQVTNCLSGWPHPNQSGTVAIEQNVPL